MILADHVAYAGHYGSERYDYSWPNLERIAKGGAKFNKAYAITPVCTPSRASFLTGKRPDKHGMRWNSEYPIPYNRTEFRDDEQLYNAHLTKAGYDNYYYGKWHCGIDKTAEDYGLNGWSLPEYGNLYASERYKEYLAKIDQPQPVCRIDHHLLRPELDGTEVLMNPDEPWDFMDGAGVLLGSAEVQEQFFIANLAIERLEELAQRKDDKPFSMVISMWGPHHPYYPSEEFANLINPDDIPKYPSFDENLDDKAWRYRIQRDLRWQHGAFERWPGWKIWQTVMARCYAAGLQTDAAIGRISDALEAAALADNTLFIVTADHGDGIAAHGAGWDKFSSFTEEVGRIPLVMRWPEGVSKNIEIASPVNLLDVTATMLDAADAVSQFDHALKPDGESLLPMINDGKLRDHMICDHYGHSGDVLFQKILYLDDWKYTSVWGDDDELYNLKDDPHELNNLIDDEAQSDQAMKMRQIILDHLTQRRDERSKWHKAEFWEDGIVFSSPEWPREETLQVYKLKVQLGLPT